MGVRLVDDLLPLRLRVVAAQVGTVVPAGLGRGGISGGTGGIVNILQQYQKAVKARDRRLGSALVVANKFLEVGQEHNFENGYSHEYQVGDMLTLCQGWADIEHSYGRAKVIRRVNHETVVIRRTQ
jgi:hypothetical protein